MKTCTTILNLAFASMAIITERDTSKKKVMKNIVIKEFVKEDIPSNEDTSENMEDVSLAHTACIICGEKWSNTLGATGNERQIVAIEKNGTKGAVVRASPS